MKKKIVFFSMILICLLLLTVSGITGTFGKFVTEIEDKISLTVNNWQENVAVTAENAQMYTSVSNGTLNFVSPKKLGVSWGKFVSIGERSFEGQQFSYTRIPDTVTSIHTDAFGGTSGVNAIIYNGDLTGAPWGSDAIVLQDANLGGAKITGVTGSKTSGYTVTLDSAVSTGKVAYCRNDGTVAYATVSNKQFTIPATSTASAISFDLKQAKMYAFATLSSDGTHLQIYNRLNSVNSTFTPDNMTGVTVYKYPATTRGGSTSSKPTNSADPETSINEWTVLASTTTSNSDDSPGTVNNDSAVTKITIEDSVKIYAPSATSPRWFVFFTNCTVIEGLNKVDTSAVTSMSRMFTYCKSLQSLDLSNFNTSKVKGMYKMFFECRSLQALDLSTFDIRAGDSGSAFLQKMFYNCKALSSIEFGENFDVNRYTDFQEMFRGCEILTSVELDFDISGAKTYYMFGTCRKLTKVGTQAENTIRLNFAENKSVINIHYAFYQCNAAKKIEFAGYVNTSDCTTMQSMFAACRQLTEIVGIEQFNTANVKSLEAMFSDCLKIEVLDLSNFNTENVTTMKNMFYVDGNTTTNVLKTIYVGSGWTTAKITNPSEHNLMFVRCTKLVGGNNTKYSYTSTDWGVDYAHIDGGTSDPGYFTCVHAIDSTKFVDGKCSVCGQNASSTVDLLEEETSFVLLSEKTKTVCIEANFCATVICMSPAINRRKYIDIFTLL